MVWIEGGTFKMGSPDTEPVRNIWGVNENPRTANNGDVTISGFYMGKYPVT
jgi:formylglycine-generating enzyme required for sulfatase activity